jgi:hypothetical protein
MLHRLVAKLTYCSPYRFLCRQEALEAGVIKECNLTVRGNVSYYTASKPVKVELRELAGFCGVVGDYVGVGCGDAALGLHRSVTPIQRKRVHPARDG